MSAMIERVKEAAMQELCRQGFEGGNWSRDEGNGVMGMDGEFDMDKLVTVMIKAVREPTTEMAEAGTDYLGKFLDVTGTYTAMIDAALS